MGEMRNAYRIIVANLNGRFHFGVSGIYYRSINWYGLIT
jgi:hypothetical protein